MLFCLSVNYTPKGLEAMGKNPKTNRREAVEKLLTAAGGKLVSMYATIADGPGAMVIFDIDPGGCSASSHPTKWWRSGQKGLNCKQPMPPRPIIGSSYCRRGRLR